MSKLIVTASSGKTVNLRKTPNTREHNILYAVPLTTEVDLLEKTSSEWYKVKYKDVEGYMMSKFLASPSTSTITQTDLRKIYNSLNETLGLIEKILK